MSASAHLPNNHIHRCYVSVAELEGLIYAMGGFDGSLRLHSAERFNRKTNQWSFIGSMNHQRSDARATTMGGEQGPRIYLAAWEAGFTCLQNNSPKLFFSVFPYFFLFFPLYFFASCLQNPLAALGS